MSAIVSGQWKRRIAEGLARKGQDPKTGHFLRGNKLGRGRPHRSEIMIRTYGDAVARSCPPQTLARVIEKAVEHALGNSRHCDGARMFLLKVLGADQIRMVINTNNRSSQLPAYKLDALDDEEMMLLDRLSAKMLIGKEEGGQL